jgi:hypothetical protein
VTGPTGPTGQAGAAGTAAVALFRSTGTVTPNNCLDAYTANQSPCSAAASFTTNGQLPDEDSILVPSSGGTISGMVVRAKDAPAANTAFTVNILDNGGATPVMSCVVSAGSNTCSTGPTPATVAVAGNHFLQVQITETLGNPTNTAWFVSFRY